MQASLSVLITNIQFGFRSGTEIVVRDLALGLMARGHAVTVYSPVLGELAEEVARRGVTVVDRLEAVETRFDIVHGHHNIPTAEALMRFPELPALWICHSSDGWSDTPPLLPGIRRYIAVDEACMDRLLAEPAIDPSRTVLLPNAVDLARIPPRRALLPDKPRSAMVFGKAASLAPLLAEACRQRGIAFSALGYTVGRVSAEPEAELAEADIVFGSARAAIEAACAGASVVVLDGRGMAGTITPANFADGRSKNFGLRSLTEPVTLGAVLREIDAYSAPNAAFVSARMRLDADLGLALDRLVLIYRAVIDEHGSRTADPELERRAVARFLHEWLPRTIGGPSFWRDEMAQLNSRIDQLAQEAARYEAQIGGLGGELEAARARVAQLEREAISTYAHAQRIERELAAAHAASAATAAS